jgi:hypothetical protein
MFSATPKLYTVTVTVPSYLTCTLWHQLYTETVLGCAAQPSSCPVPDYWHVLCDPPAVHGDGDGGTVHCPTLYLYLVTWRVLCDPQPYMETVLEVLPSTVPVPDYWRVLCDPQLYTETVLEVLPSPPPDRGSKSAKSHVIRRDRVQER